LPNTETLGLHCIVDSMTVSLTQLVPKTAILCEITRNDGYLAFQGHSRSPILVRIESPYSDFLLVNNNRSYLAPLPSYLGILIKLLLETGVSPQCI